MNKEKIIKIVLIALGAIFVIGASINAVDYFMQQSEWRKSNAEFDSLSRDAASLAILAAVPANPTPKYTVEKNLGTACEDEKDCKLPFDYAIQSRCAFTTKCINSICSVVCPESLSESD